MFRKNHLSGRPHVVNSPKNTSLKSNTTKIKIKITSQEWRNYNIATEARFLIKMDGPQLIFTGLKLTMKTDEKGVKYVHI